MKLLAIIICLMALVSCSQNNTPAQSSSAESSSSSVVVSEADSNRRTLDPNTFDGIEPIINPNYGDIDIFGTISFINGFISAVGHAEQISTTADLTVPNETSVYNSYDISDNVSYSAMDKIETFDLIYHALSIYDPTKADDLVLFESICSAMILLHTDFDTAIELIEKIYNLEYFEHITDYGTLKFENYEQALLFSFGYNT